MKERVLITGGTGFVGANLVRALVKAGYDVHLLLRHESNLWRLNDIRGQFSEYRIDYTQAAEVESLLTKVRPSTVFHLSTYGAYPYRYGQPYQQDVLQMVNTNIVGLINLIRSAVHSDVSLFINIGSSSEYGVKDQPMSELDRLEPADSYGATKASATLIGSTLARSLGITFSTLRLFSVYGYYEERARLIPTVVLGALRGETLRLANGNSVRDFIFIEDVIDAMLLLLQIRNIPDVINLGTGNQHSVNDVVDIVSAICGPRLKVEWGAIDSRPSEPMRWVSNNERLLETGFKPKYTLHEGISKTLKWFQQNAYLYC